MNRSVAIGILAVIAALVIGAIAYQAGVSQGLVSSGQVGTVVDGRYAYHPGGFGWGFFPLFGLLFPLLFIFLIFGLVRAAFGGPRWGNGGPWMDRRTMAEEWHRQMHRSSGEPRDSGPPA